MRGSKVPRKKELEFRQKLLEVGFVSGAAKACKIPVSTGFLLAARAEKDSDFVKAREEMRARVVPEVEARLLRLAETVEKRVAAPDLTPKQLAKIAVDHELKSFSYANPKPQYFRGLVDLYGKLGADRKAAKSSAQPTGAGGRIEVVLTDGLGLARDDASEAHEPVTE